MRKEDLRLRLLENLIEIEMVLSRGVENIFPGVHASISQGGGLEFETYGTYRQGSRGKIDWVKTLKPGSRVVIRKYHQEKEARMAMFLDLTPSMNFGSKYFSKKDLGVLAVGVLGCSAFISGDEVDLIGFNEDIQRYNSIPNKDFFIEHLLDLREPLPDQKREKKKENRKKKFNSLFLLEEILGYRGDIVFIASDFIAENDKEFIDVIKQAAVDYEVAPILISDFREKVLPPSGIIEARDPESDEIITIDCSSKKQREEFEKITNERIKEFGRVMSELGVLWVEAMVREDKKWIEELIRLFLIKKYLTR